VDNRIALLNSENLATLRDLNMRTTGPEADAMTTVISYQGVKTSIHSRDFGLIDHLQLSISFCKL
jgi:hypothetical protein